MDMFPTISITKTSTPVVLNYSLNSEYETRGNVCNSCLLFKLWCVGKSRQKLTSSLRVLLNELDTYIIKVSIHIF